MTCKNKPVRHRGSSTLEMTLVGIPLIFVIISTVEMARGMWIYHTLAYSLKEGTRFAIVHGQNCSTPPNNCAVKVSDIAKVIQKAGVALDPSLLKVEMQSTVDDVGPNLTLTLSTLLTTNTLFPTPSTGTTVGGGSMETNITFLAQYPFQSAIAIFWPGAGKGMQFPTFNLPASSQEKIQF